MPASVRSPKNGSYRQAAKEFEFLLDSMPDNVLVKNGLESARKAPVWRNAFLGAGLCAMFAWWDADFLAGIGALVFFYGLGQTLIGSLPAIKDWWKNRHGNQGTGYNGTPV